MLRREVDEYIRRHQLIEANSTVVVGVSGGPDSMALLQYLLEKRSAFQLDLIAIIIEHGLRGEESESDVTYVRDFCEKHKVKFAVDHIDVNQYKKEEKMGTQEAARILRYRSFDQLMKKYQADYLALAHHADDQVETVYMRLTRGTQLDLLKGISPSRQFSTGKLIRPLLSVTKDMIEAYCAENGIIPRRDLSNEEAVYTRNYFRLNILPLLKEKNSNLPETIMRLTENIADDVKYLSEQTERVSYELLKMSEKPKKVSFQVNQLKKHPLALQRRLFHLILDYLYDRLPRGLTYKHEQQFFDLMNNSRANASVDFPSQLKMVKSYQSMTFYFEESHSLIEPMRLEFPGEAILANGTTVTTEIIDEVDGLCNDPMTFYLPLDIDRPPSLVVRTRMPGDRIYLSHVNGRKKIKDLFIDKKIPLIQRDQWPLVTQTGNEVLWVIGLEKSHINKRLNQDHYLKITYQSHQKEQGDFNA